VYVRIVEVEASLDAKSDDTLDVCETEKRYSLVVVSPQNKGLFWDAESHDGKKKEKTVGSKSPKKLCSPLCLEKDFVSCDTLFGLC
jgi:hypothetical protein